MTATSSASSATGAGHLLDGSIVVNPAWLQPAELPHVGGPWALNPAYKGVQISPADQEGDRGSGGPGRCIGPADRSVPMQYLVFGAANSSSTSSEAAVQDARFYATAGEATAAYQQLIGKLTKCDLGGDAFVKRTSSTSSSTAWNEQVTLPSGTTSPATVHTAHYYVALNGAIVTVVEVTGDSPKSTFVDYDTKQDDAVLANLRKHVCIYDDSCTVK